MTPDVRTLILFEDDDLIAFNKPAGLPSQATRDPNRQHLARAALEYLKIQGVQNPYVGEHHRLDRDTSGIIVFTKSRRANPALAQSFRTRAVNKTYFAITAAGSCKAEWTIRNYLAEDKGGKRMKAVFSGGQPAETLFTFLSGSPRALFLLASPRSGRRHQIRVHLSLSGLPILGDALYGDGTEDVSRIMLHARSLELDHPVSGRPLRLVAPIPEDFKTCALNYGLQIPENI